MLRFFSVLLVLFSLGLSASAQTYRGAINGTVTAHAQSTAHVDLQATWSEWDDYSGAWVPRAARVASTRLNCSTASSRSRRVASSSTLSPPAEVRRLSRRWLADLAKVE